MAGQVGQGSLPFSYSDFHGGLNTLDAPYLLEDNQARDLSNVQGTTAGAIIKRNGLVTLASPSNILTSLFAFENLATEYLIGADASALYSIKNDGTVTSIKTGLSNKNWSFVSAPIVSSQGPLFGMNGTDTPQQWSGTVEGAWTNASGSVGVPNGTMMVYNQNQVFVAGTTSAPTGSSGVVDPASTVYWSAIANPTNWDSASNTGAGFASFDPNDGQAISGLGVVGPYVLVAKPRKLWVIVNPATATIRMISNNIGVASHRSIAQGAEGTYFLSEDRGVFVTNGSKLTPISDKIRPSLDGIASGKRANAAGVYFGNHYYLSVQTGNTANDTTFDYDATLGSWWKHSFAANQFAIWHPSGNATQANLYQAAADAAKVDQCFTPSTYTDRGSAMTWVWRGPWQSPSFYRRRRFPTPYMRKRLRQIRIQGKGTVDFSLSKDFAGLETLVRSSIFSSSGPTVWGQGGFTWGQSGDTWGGVSVELAKIHGQGVANAWSIVLGSTSTTNDEVFMYMYALVDRRDQIPD